MEARCLALADAEFVITLHSELAETLAAGILAIAGYDGSMPLCDPMCGSGTLVNAGSGNPVGLLALPFFAIGSFAGAMHLSWWTALGTAPMVALAGVEGLALTLAGLAGGAASSSAFSSAKQIS